MTIDDLSHKLDGDLSWRKIEISHLYSLLLKNQENESLLKSMLLMIYAHWEGYIKNISKLYLEYVGKKKINLDELSDNFHCIVLKGVTKTLLQSTDSISIENELNFHQKLREKQKKPFLLANCHLNSRDKSIINSKDNLNYNVFIDILKTIGLDCFSTLKTRENYFHEFLDARNSVSHGDKITSKPNIDFNLSLEYVTQLKNFTLEIMSRVQDSIKEYVQQELYLKSKYMDKENYNKKHQDELSTYISSIDSL